MLKPFPKKLIKEWIKVLQKKGLSYREIQRYFEVEGYTTPSLGFISKTLSKKKRK